MGHSMKAVNRDVVTWLLKTASTLRKKISVPSVDQTGLPDWNPDTGDCAEVARLRT